MLERELSLPVPPTQAADLVSALNSLPDQPTNPEITAQRYYAFMKLGQYDKAITVIDALL